ncbi:MAG: hypothetical protein R2828_04495 [Saprospiraceae bacterium]
MNNTIYNAKRPYGLSDLIFRKSITALLAVLLLFLMLNNARAEGVKQVAPNPDDFVMLLIDEGAYGNFGAYNGPENSRLYFDIKDPNEVVYLGLTRAYRQSGEPFSVGTYEFRIRRLSDGAIVHGPFSVNAFTENVSSWADAALGPKAITGQGYETTDARYVFDPDQAGKYFIEFKDVTVIGHWDITVAKDNQAINGRVYSTNWAFRTPTKTREMPECVWDREFNGIIYSYTSDGFVSKIDFSNSGFQGLSFNVAFNRTGPGSTGNLELDRQSVPAQNLTSNSAEHLIFLNEPDIFLFPDGVCGELSVSTNFLCGDTEGYCIPVDVTRPGQVEVILDFNQNGVYDPELGDVILIHDFEEGDDFSTCIPWDGLKGDGTPAGLGDIVDLSVRYTQGVQHWALFDAEFLKQGFCVEVVRPVCNFGNSSNVLYWDDRNIPDSPGTNSPKDGRAGCECRTEGCRTFTNFNPNIPNCDRIEDDITTGYGDKNTLNTWWFASSKLNVFANIPIVAVQIEAEAEVCANTSTEIHVAINGTLQVATIAWEGPNGPISTGGPNNTTIVVDEPGLYIARVTDIAGCQITATHTLTHIICPIDIELDKSVDNAQPSIGEVVTFTIKVTNFGPGLATGVQVRDYIPNGLSNLTAISNGGTFNGTQVVWSNLVLNEGQVLNLTFDATVVPGTNYINLAEVTVMDQPDEDSTPGNGVDTDNDGNVEDDPGDEDDGDGVVLHPQACNIAATVSNINCNNNGTNADPADDVFYFTLFVAGTSTSDEWVAPSLGIQGAYNTLLTFGPFPIAGGNLNFLVQDRFFAGLCTANVTVTAPTACSNDCFVKASYENVICDDNGTPDNPLDDTYTAELTVAGFNTGNNWVIDLGNGQIIQGPYEEPVTIGPFLVIDGNKFLVIKDVIDQSCDESLEIQAPPFCSPACAIQALAQNIQCNDNGTPSNPNDDTFTFDLLVNDLNNASLSWETTDGLTGFYGFARAMGPYPISGGAVAFNIVDSEDPSCTAFLSVDPPATCSDDCVLSVDVVQVKCDDQGTDSDGDDDTYTVLITVRAVNANGRGWRVEGEGNIIRQYGNSLTLGPYLIRDGGISFTIVDVDDPDCKQQVEIDAPPHCSTQCNMETTISNTRCDDNGTPANPADDIFFFDVLITGQNVSTGGWTTSDGRTSGQYGVLTTVGPYPIASGAASVFIIDNDDQGCNSLLFVPAPQTCSDQCSIEDIVSNIRCENNGTPADPSDDVFYFNLRVNALNNTGIGWKTEGVTFGQYGQTVQMGPYPITANTLSLLIEDLNDASCTTTVEVVPPATCSNQCIIEAVSSRVECFDNNTPSRPDDDLYYFIVTVNAINQTGNIWTATDGENQYTGTYNVAATLGPFPISEGNTVLTFSDLNNSDCTFEVEVVAPPTCSDACEITETLVQNILCYDNNTPADPSDDVFTFELTVSALNPGTGWVSSNAQTGAYNTKVLMGPFPIAEGDVTLTIADAESPDDCSAEITVTPPAPCSNDCLIFVELVDVSCDDKGTIDNPFDDTYTYTIIVNGQNGGTTWVASDGTSGTYGEVVTSEPHRVTEGNIIVKITDEETGLCSYDLEVGPPVPEIECPEDTEQARQTTLVQTVQGDLTANDLLFSNIDSLCWLPTDYFMAGNHYYDLINFKTVPGENPVGYTFILYTDMEVNPVPNGWPNGMVDGVGTLFWGEYYPLEPCCYTQVSGTTPYPLSIDQFRSPYVDTTGLFDRPMTAVSQFAMMLAPDQVYSLLTTTWLAANRGHYAWVIVGGNNTQPIIFTDENVDQATFPNQGVRYDLSLDDIETVLNNVDALDWLGEAVVSDSYCGVDTITFVDRLNDFDDCDDATINRTFYLRDINGNVDSCDQIITFRRNDLDDVFLPAGTAIFNCGETFEETEEGAPHPDVTGYPFVLTLNGYAELVVGSNDNITVVYKDLFNYQSEDVFTVSREWSIIDVCAFDTINTFIQTIKVGGFSEPIIECPTSNHYCPILEENIMLFQVDPFECTATLEVPFPVVSSPCGPGDWLVRTEVYSDTTLAPLFVIGPNDNRTITDVPIGDYFIKYIVYDEVGREFIHYCIFRVGDLQEPVAICRSGIMVNLDANGNGRLFIPDINNGSYDNCGVDSVQIRRRYDFDPNTCEALQTPYYSAWGNSVSFTCCDAGTQVVVEMRVVDVNGNENMCWMYTQVKDDLPPTFNGINDRTISCEDLPLDFNPYDSIQLRTLFGWPEVTSNCGATALEIEPTVVWDDCNYGSITRRFRAINARGVPTNNLYTQLITVTRNLAYEIRFPKDTETNCLDLTDTLMLNRIGCDSFTVDFVDEFLPIEGQECYNLIRTYHVINHCEWNGFDDPMIISRDEDCDGQAGEENVWVLRLTDTTYIDRDSFAFNSVPALQTKGQACDGLTNPKGYWRKSVSTGYWVYSQKIKVFDKVPPIISFTPIAPVCTQSSDCEELVEYPFIVTEGCFLDSISSIRVFFDAFSNGTLDEELPSTAVVGTSPYFTIRHSFPIGAHRLELRVADGCGNSNSANLRFEVRDCFVPDPVCFNGKVVNLAPVPPGTDNDGDGEEDEAGVTVLATDIIDAFDPECTQPLRFSINRLNQPANINQGSLAFTCADRYSAEVELHIWDGAFNPDAPQPDGTIGGFNNKSCRVTVYIQDENNLCSSCADDTALEGLIESTVPLPANTNVVLDVENYGRIETENGYFFAPGVSLGETYTVKPELDKFPRFGITTLDVIRIYRHILGDLPLETPYQLIAADVNNTQTITTLDMVEIRRLLLNNIDHFTNNPSFRFVPKAYAFPVPENPWFEAFPESIVVENVSTCVLGLDFVSIKIGDVVNGSNSNGLTSNGLEERDRNDFLIEATDQTVYPGERHYVSFRVPKEKLVEGYQFSLQIDPMALELVDIQYGLAKAGHFGWRFANEGIITSSWNQETDLPADVKSVELFTLEVEAKTKATLSELIQISSTILTAEAYDQSGELMNVKLDWNPAEKPEKAFTVWQNFPNPFNKETSIQFEIQTPGLVQLIIHNPEGQLIYHHEAMYTMGRHKLSVRAEDLPGSGLLYYTLKAGEHMQTQRMVLMK